MIRVVFSMVVCMLILGCGSNSKDQDVMPTEVTPEMEKTLLEAQKKVDDQERVEWARRKAEENKK